MWKSCGRLRCCKMANKTVKTLRKYHLMKNLSCISCKFVNDSCAIELKNIRAYFKSLLVQLLTIDQHLSRSTSAIMYNLGLRRHAPTTFIHLSTTVQQNMITLSEAAWSWRTNVTRSYITRLHFFFHSNAMSFTVIRWRLAAFYPQTRLIQPFESNLSSYHLTNMNHNTIARLFDWPKLYLTGVPEWMMHSVFGLVAERCLLMWRCHMGKLHASCLDSFIPSPYPLRHERVSFGQVRMMPF